MSVSSSFILAFNTFFFFLALDFDDLEERKDSGEQRVDGHVGQYDASMMESPKHGYDQQQAVYVSINSASY